jgi:hypothetical protein
MWTIPPIGAKCAKEVRVLAEHNILRWRKTMSGWRKGRKKERPAVSKSAIKNQLSGLG